MRIMEHDPTRWRRRPNMTRQLTFFCVLLVGAALAVVVSAQVTGSLALGRQYTQMFFDRKFEQLSAAMSDEMRKDQGSIRNLSGFWQTVQDVVGKEIKLLSETVITEGDQEVYVRRVRYEKSAEPFDLKWTLDRQGMITDFSIRPALSAAEFKYHTKTRLQLPFEGEWYVASGGRTPEQNSNHYYDYLSRFDNDFVKVEDTRFARNDNPPRNEDFAAFGRPILAPGAGKVALTRDRIPDNKPGQINLKPDEKVGNYVVIAHGNGEYSLLAHLKNGSIKVRPGEIVAPGQVLGECGNSGNSSGPHLHYGLHRAAHPDKGMSVPAQFQHYFADGKRVKRGEPLRGQKIRSLLSGRTLDDNRCTTC